MIGKPEYEILTRFISGLPEQLAFFVRAGSPKDLMSALTQAKMGETCGYRNHFNSHVSNPLSKFVNSNDTSTASTLQTPIAAAMSCTRSPSNPQPNEDITELKGQVKYLTDIITKLSLSSGHEMNMQTQRSPPKCYSCQGIGHTRRNCQWNGTGAPAPNIQCQLCNQSGHSAACCKMLHNNHMQMGTATNQGNRMCPGTARHNSPGNQQ